MSEALLAFAAMLALTFLRVPIAFAMGTVGIGGIALMKGWAPAMAMATQVTYETGFSYLFSVVPLFILMGTFVSRAGMAEELYAACYAFIGHLRGGLAMATIAACGGFGAICGSSLATAATMSQVAMPQMRKFGYSNALGTGCIAAGGTLGILIPPSTVLVLYGIITSTSIGKLFAAGILPGLLGVFLYAMAVQWTTWRDPKSGPPGERLSWRERFATLRGVGAFLALGAGARRAGAAARDPGRRRAGAGRVRHHGARVRLPRRNQRDRPVHAGDGRHLRRHLHPHRGRRRGRDRERSPSRWRGAS